MDALPPSDAPLSQPASVRVTLECAYCRGEGKRDDLAFCGSCLAPHHPDCFSQHGRCSIHGCGGRAVIRPEPIDSPTPRHRRIAARSPRRSRVPFAVALFLCLGFTWAVAYTIYVNRLALLEHRQTRERNSHEAEVDHLRAQLNARAEAPESEAPWRDLRHWESTPAVTFGAQDELLSTALSRLSVLIKRTIVLDPSIPASTTASLPTSSRAWTRTLGLLAAQAESTVETLPGDRFLLKRMTRASLPAGSHDARQALLSVARQARINLIVRSRPGVLRTVVAGFSDLPWDAALVFLARAAGLHLSQIGDIVLATDEPLPDAKVFEESSALRWPTEYKLDSFKRSISLVCKNERLADVAKRLGKEAGIEVFVDPVAQDRLCTLSLRWVSVDEAFVALARHAQVWSTARFRWRDSTLDLEDKGLSLNANAADLAALLVALAELSDLNLTVAADVNASVQLRLENVAPRQVLKALYTILDLKWTRDWDARAIEIRTRESPPPGSLTLGIGGEPTPLRATLVNGRGAVALLGREPCQAGTVVRQGPLKGWRVESIRLGSAIVRDPATGTRRTLHVLPRPQ